MRAAMLQMNVAHDKQKNLERARQMLEQANREGAELAVLPEMFCCPYSNRFFRSYGEEEGGPAWQALSGMAREFSFYLVAGSMPELKDGQVYNTAYVFDRTGQQIAKHRKAHLFDIDVEGGQRFQESETLSPGDQITVFDTEFGRLGLCICFDFRFQEMAKAMADRGAQLIVVPAAFNMTTGPAHWDMSLRMRALDNQVYAMGCSPARNTESSYVAYGYSLVASPWGDIRGKLDETPGILIETVDTEWIDAVREQLPLISAMRTDRYTLPDWKD